MWSSTSRGTGPTMLAMRIAGEHGQSRLRGSRPYISLGGDPRNCWLPRSYALRRLPLEAEFAVFAVSWRCQTEILADSSEDGQLALPLVASGDCQPQLLGVPCMGGPEFSSLTRFETRPETTRWRTRLGFRNAVR